jgi:hypothetical protein
LRLGNETSVISASQDGRAKVWNWQAGNVVELRAYSTALFSAEFDPRDPQWALTGGQEMLWST